MPVVFAHSSLVSHLIATQLSGWHLEFTHVYSVNYFLLRGVFCVKKVSLDEEETLRPYNFDIITNFV